MRKVFAVTTNFLLIGIPLTEENFTSLAENFYDNPETVVTKTAYGHSAMLRDPSGSEIWMYFDNDGEFLTMNPFFSRGEPPFVSKVAPSVGPELPYGAFESYAAIDILENGETATRSGAHFINLPHYAPSPAGKALARLWAPKHRKRTHTIETTADLVIFSHGTEIFETDKDFFDSQDSEVQYGIPSFIPFGLFETADGYDNSVGGAGRIKDYEMNVIGMGNTPYHWALVDGIGGNFTVVWAEHIGPPPQLGSVLSYDGMMISRQIEDSPKTS
ncbi:hypothetical protein RXV86_07935 [Alisedimentitalea sp. MJ-SS2]|uniref:hypothetical protein n=1 Tax=Aliisedimentitalea sp. MJ-SS2 TaxID=3049795 RepID=UPI00290BCD7D|nr:hypothetical protein [Alisedimentitalea sp. MJ-SS2]MDU8927311.1 hypothetical protein [Alisedimentitalea sp. MJ-SS2]